MHASASRDDTIHSPCGGSFTPMATPTVVDLVQRKSTGLPPRSEEASVTRMMISLTCDQPTSILQNSSPRQEANQNQDSSQLSPSRLQKNATSPSTSMCPNVRFDVTREPSQCVSSGKEGTAWNPRTSFRLQGRKATPHPARKAESTTTE